ncbi:MAG TPA: hypothetical protein VHA76_04560 [Solirubrobacterales bacterium]|nr:hypothetical protein [Solirubrobacterales bacterium]
MNRQLNLLVALMLAHATTLVLLGGPRVEAAFEAGVIIGAGLALSQTLGG